LRKKPGFLRWCEKEKSCISWPAAFESGHRHCWVPIVSSKLMSWVYMFLSKSDSVPSSPAVSDSLSKDYS
jgi:hypothetical protein